MYTVGAAASIADARKVVLSDRSGSKSEQILGKYPTLLGGKLIRTSGVGITSDTAGREGTTALQLGT
jgi:hypothetical protein